MTIRHDWTSLPERRIAAVEFSDGNGRTEKTCGHPDCGLVKITVHPPQGYPWREWRHANGKTFTCEATPPCVPRVVYDSADGAASAEEKTARTTV